MKIFVSYTSSDREWAHWIGWQLKSAGHEPFVHDWEIGAGESIAGWMEERIKQADRLIGVFSDEYCNAAYSQTERWAAFWEDPRGRSGYLVPVEVRKVSEWPGFVRPLKRLSLVDLDEMGASRELLAFLQPAHGPTEKPSFPGAARRLSEGAAGFAEGSEPIGESPPSFPAAPSSASDFRLYVGALLKDLGYTVIPRQEVHTKRLDFIIEYMNELEIKQRTIVECKTGSQTISDVVYDEFNQLYQRYREELSLTGAMFVYDCNVSDQVQRSATLHSNDAQLVHISQLERSAFGLPFRELTKIAQLDNRAKGPFVDPGVRDLADNNNISDTLQCVSKIASQDGSIVFLLGSIGSGKTTVLGELVRQFNQRRSQVLRDSPVYLLVPLRRYSPDLHHDSIFQYAANYLSKKGAVPDCNALTLNRLVSSKKVVLVFDGLDELRFAADSEDMNAAVTNWLAELRNARTTIFSCRSSYFHVHFAHFLSQRTVEGAKVTVLRIQPFGPDKVINYSNLVNSPRLRNILHTHGCTQLMTRPMFLDVARRLPELDDVLARRISEVEFVETSISLMLHHSKATRISQRSPEQWIALLTYIAGLMLGRRYRAFARPELERSVVNFWGEPITETDMEYILADTMFRTIFELTEDGFEFAHSVFHEYFRARAITQLGASVIGGIVSLFGNEVSGDFTLSAYDYFLSRAIKEKTTEAVMKFGIKWCRIPSAVVVSRIIDSRNREVHRLRVIPHDFWISESPIIPDQVQDSIQFLKDGALRRKFESHLRRADKRQVPITNITYNDAKQICAEMFGGRLPNEVEWQWACMPFQTEPFYAGRRSSSALPSYPSLQTGAWGVKGAMRTVWQWTSSYDGLSGAFVCCGGWWRDDAEGSAGWRLLPSEEQHFRTGVRVLIEARQFARS